ncbi:UNVERIFIED_CONTAM: hypothetical protein HDU68_010432 [Siphonaria sp. JEL0065]|nr:hypothetical protein HDU68_010432 [Siphonaria sp. JEL0065]
MISSNIPSPSRQNSVNYVSQPNSAASSALGVSGPSAQGMQQQQSDLFRSRNKKRDDLIRKKAENELSRKVNHKRLSVASAPSNNLQPPSFNKRSKGFANTVASLKPNQAITVLETARIVQAAQLMAAKRADAVLVVNEEGQLSGILTDKDIAYRVVAEGLDLRQTTVSQCMTRNPVAVLDKGPRNEALSVMVSRRFRHLPVIAAEEDDGVDAELGSTTTTATSTNVVGLLDITKCVFERLDDLEKKVLEDANIVAAMEALERRGHLDGDQVGVVRAQHGCPDLHSILTKNDLHGGDVPEVSIKASVRDAAKVMKQFHQTAVLVLSANGGGVEEKLGGIFTTKDIVLRVIAAGLDPATTSVVRVMTPHPDSVDSSTSILDALKKLHVGHYLHLPVVQGQVPVGLVDVLTLTMGMLDYLMNKETGGEVPENSNSADSQDGPMWNKFWNSTFNNGSVVETESIAESIEDDHKSVASSHQYHQMQYQPPPPQVLSPRPYRQSMQISGIDRFSPPPQMAYVPPPSTIGSFAPPTDPTQFGYKLRDKRSAKVHRFTSSSQNVSEVYAAIRGKTGTAPGVVSYEDEEGDLILLGSNADLEEAVGIARRLGWERLVLHIGEAPVPVVAPVTAKGPSSIASASPVRGGGKSGDKRLARRGSFGEQGSVTEFLRDAPLAVNVAISAGIVVIAAFVISRFTGR